MHKYDFTTWFLQKVGYFDSEMLSLFTQFLAIEIGNKNSLNVPLFIQKITELFPDLKSPNLLF